MAKASRLAKYCSRGVPGLPRLAAASVVVGCAMASAMTVHAEHREDLFDLSLQQLMELKVSSPTLTPQTLQDTPRQ